MKRHAILILTAVLLLAGDDPKKDAVHKELEKLQGDWRVISAERDGKKIAVDQFKNETVTFKGDQMIVTKGRIVVQRSKLILDPTTSPKSFVREVTEGIGKGAKYHGIYELDGDTFKECRTTADRDRPKEFSSKNEAFLGAYKHAKL
jgi:uncharacterized protein (TIGR03067 family)